MQFRYVFQLYASSLWGQVHSKIFSASSEYSCGQGVLAAYSWG